MKITSECPAVGVECKRRISKKIFYVEIGGGVRNKVKFGKWERGVIECKSDKIAVFTYGRTSEILKLYDVNVTIEFMVEPSEQELITNALEAIGLAKTKGGAGNWAVEEMIKFGYRLPENLRDVKGDK